MKRNILIIAVAAAAALSAPSLANAFGGHGQQMQGYGGPAMMQGYGPQGMKQGYGPQGMKQGQMMGRGMRGHRMQQSGSPANVDLQLTPELVKSHLEMKLKWRNNPNIKVGNVTEKDANTIIAEIVTKTDSLVRRFEIDKKTGWSKPVN